MCSRNNILRVQPDVLDPWRPVLLQEGVHLIPAWNEHNSDTGVVLSSNVAELNHLFKDGSGCCWSPCSGRDSAMTNLQSGSFLSTKGRAMPASLHFQYSMAVSRRPMPSWFMTKPSFTSSLLLRKQQTVIFNNEIKLNEWKDSAWNRKASHLSMKNLLKPKSCSYHLMTCWVVFLGHA